MRFYELVSARFRTRISPRTGLDHLPAGECMKGGAPIVYPWRKLDRKLDRQDASERRLSSKRG